jgi:hypothetical protein
VRATCKRCKGCCACPRVRHDAPLRSTNAARARRGGKTHCLSRSSFPRLCRGHS